MDGWIPLSTDARKGLDRALPISLVVGDRYIFCAPKAKCGVDKPWSRLHARDLLERAVQGGGGEARRWRLASTEAQMGGEFALRHTCNASRAGSFIGTT